ncbi:TELO2-interacting protein 1 homolog [Dreissena polymorpha]|uniref:TELO2-interacting protein 1 homolog n=1 Tax=Dreissena polymorpha TaxID=45954 RepID=UPI002264F927|nr:TELO2-interacting protein 1 homolog [Dreissena polymorpha]
MDALRSEAFSRLKPFCVQLTREHTRENIAKLFTALQSVDIVYLQDLQEYVIFPLRIILKHPKKSSQDLYLDLYACMEYVLGHTKVTRWDLFHDIFHTATTMLSCPTDQSKVAHLSEELKIAIIQTLRTLVKNAECSVVQQLYGVMCLPLLGHSVSLLLNIAEMERARNLRILAMECLLDFSQADSKLSACMKADIGNMYASFLPGISVTLCKIITGDTKQGYAVTSKAIYVWMRIVSLVMDDRLLEIYRNKQNSKSQQQKQLDERLAGLVVTRDNGWLASTSDNLCILVKQVTNVRSHCNWRVRLGLVECAEHLLLHCNSSMKACVPHFLEILVSLISDDYSKVAEGSRHALELFSTSQSVTDQQHRLTELLEDNMLKLTTSLPRQIQTAEEEDKLSLLNLLIGYLGLLGTKVRGMLLSLPHLKRLSLALLQILELECSDMKIVEERTCITGHGSSAVSSSGATSIIRPRRHFKHFNNERIYDKVRGVCQLLGYYGDLQVLLDHFLDVFHETSLFRLQATLIMNEIMLGTTGETAYTNNSKNGRSWQTHGKDELSAVVRMLVDEYLSQVNFDLVTSVTAQSGKVQSLEHQLRHLAVTNTSPENDLSAAKLNRNILQISLFLEGFGNFAKILKTGFEPLLMSALYPMLEKLGDESAVISNTAFIALGDVCHACRYKSIDQLIRENADYLMNSISLRLRHLDRNRKCPLVLKVMLQYSSAQLLPLIQDTVQEILDSLDDNYAEEAAMFMGVLNELAKAVVRWFPDKHKGKNSDKHEDRDQKSQQGASKGQKGNNGAGPSEGDGIGALARTRNWVRDGVGAVCCEGCGCVVGEDDGDVREATGKIRGDEIKGAGNTGKGALKGKVEVERDMFQEVVDINCSDRVHVYKKCSSKVAVKAGTEALGSNVCQQCLKMLTLPEDCKHVDNSENLICKCPGMKEPSENHLGLSGQGVGPFALGMSGQSVGHVSLGEGEDLVQGQFDDVEPSLDGATFSLPNGTTECERCRKTLPASRCVQCIFKRFNTVKNHLKEKEAKDAKDRNCENFDELAVTKTLCKACKLKAVESSTSKVCLESEIAGSAPTISDVTAKEVEGLATYFSDLLALEKESAGEITEEDLENFQPTQDDLDPTDPPEVALPLPGHMVAVREVMLRCKHILSSPRPQLRLLVLDTISHTCLALDKHQDELLPLIHKIWPPFSLCFADEEKLVTIKAIDVLRTVARCSGDFVKHRVTKDVLPKLASFLQNQSEISVHAGASYQFTVNYKLQLAILNNISSIAQMACIKGSNLDLITTSCLPYLHIRQPSTLQKACIECCRGLIDIDPDLIWLKLCPLFCPKAYEPPSGSFKPIRGLGKLSTSNPYTGNITRLMADTKLL